MNKTLRNLALASSTMAAASTALATNGDNLIGVGPISRAMGGTGIAAPQDAISAVFANPAAMCFTPGCDYAEVNFAGTMFAPTVDGTVQINGMPAISAESKKNVYAIPAIGVSVPIDPDSRRLRFGLAAYGVTGLGVDYRGTDLDTTVPTGMQPPMPSQVPLIQGEYTSLQIMKFAPSLAYQLAPNFSVGLAAHIDYAVLDLRNGSSPSYGLGAQLGLSWSPTDKLSVGFTYVTPQNTSFDKAVHYTADMATFSNEDLDLESPHIVGLGVAYRFLDNRLLTTVEGKYLNWSGAKGYKDFDWEDQWVIGAGVQFAAIPDTLFLRAGYNYGNNPVKENNGWGAGARDVQGMSFPDYYYETFRVIGFPAVVEHHLTAGIGYAFSKKFELHLAYMHAFANTISEDGYFFGTPVNISSTLSEDSLDFGLTWRF
jgi:long-chain fatty acid transport protein